MRPEPTGLQPVRRPGRPSPMGLQLVVDAWLVFRRNKIGLNIITLMDFLRPIVMYCTRGTT